MEKLWRLEFESVTYPIDRLNDVLLWRDHEKLFTDVLYVTVDGPIKDIFFIAKNVE